VLQWGKRTNATAGCGNFQAELVVRNRFFQYHRVKEKFTAHQSKEEDK
jgi:hypothetical protein